jgi:hypothetical protein
MFIAEKGIAVPLVAVDLGKGEQHSPIWAARGFRRALGRASKTGSSDRTYGYSARVSWGLTGMQ